MTSSRNPQNGYRMFNRSQIRKISLLRALRPALYSLTVVELKQAVAQMDHDDAEHAGKIARDTLNYASNESAAASRRLLLVRLVPPIEIGRLTSCS
nr:hypothetical protein [Paenibacillus mesophilus]